ncbi:hypothetical protein [Methylocella tundrae]|uniref:Uncharacterized protein n=1 Tax=Methylocella tundrae TaxID=227605 RepID=A0A4U8Z7E8_METTU|nr:hypothetical protein [Methylocella tundrae]WPP03057.1 hypothetical protein SIN04_01475 [Methylocella tundrae]VFU16316.1 conserved protein of unknown function [Methylocella tundrae]
MRRPPKLPDLDQLTDAQKDELIVSLWRTLVAVDGLEGTPAATATATTGALEPAVPAAAVSTDDLRAAIRGAAPSRRTRAPSPGSAGLGRGFGFFDSRPLQILLLVVGFFYLADFGVGWFQRRALAARDQAELALRNAAFGGLYVELTRVAYEPDGKSYRATLNMQNSNPATPLYVMLNPPRVYVQVGLTWQEAPAQAPPGSVWGVVKLDGGREYSLVFQTDLKDWSQLIPGYMHVLIQSDMLISQSSEPKDDIVERDNRFYVYLKPQGADDAWIKSRSNFPGVPPIFIPMPPH